MLRPRLHPLWLSTALAAVLALNASPATAQLAQTKKQEAAAASGQQATSGTVPLRVGLVISDAVRSYRTVIMLTRIEFGRRLADKAVKIFNETFTSVRQMTELPSDPHGYDGLDLVVIVEAPEGHVQSAFFGPATFTLTVRFTIRTANGEQIFQTQETASEQSRSVAQGPDQAGEAVVRKFIQELVLNTRVRTMLSPAPAAPAEVKVAIDDTTVMDSSGLDVPPPPPWPGAPAPAAGVPAPANKP